MLFPLYGRRAGVRLALGLHPLEVEKVDVRRELDLFRAYASHTSYIGEIGLDFSRDGKRSRAPQVQALDAVLSAPGVIDKVLTVHSRAAAKEIVQRLSDAGARRAILHWFAGSGRDLEAALEAGFYFSINPAMTRNTKGQTIIGALPRERLLAESDGPYVRLGGRVLEPVDVVLVLNHLAERWRASADEVSAQLSANLVRLCDGLASPPRTNSRADVGEWSAG